MNVRTIIAMGALGFALARPAPAQTIITVAGCCESSGSPGAPGYNGDAMPATSADLNGPEAAAADAAGNLYITDTQNCLIRKVTASTGLISTLAGTVAGAGTGSNCGYGGDGGPATQALLNKPAGAVVDSSGNLYIADYSNCLIRKVTASTGEISTIAGTIAGAGTGRNCGYNGDGGPGTFASISVPHGVSRDSSGNLYIADSGNNVIRKLAASSNIISTVAGNGVEGYGGDGGPATDAQFNHPERVAVNSAEDLFIADTGNDVIRLVSAATGLVSTVAGTPLHAGYSGDGAAATAAELNLPYGVGVDSSGDFYIADTSNSVIRKVTASTQNISTVAGCCAPSGVQGYNGDGGPATSANLFNPQGVTFASSGNLYIADTANNVIRAVVPQLQLSPTPAALSVVGGQQGNVSIAVSAGEPVSSVVTFACSGLPPDATCAFSPESLSTLPATVTMTISTTSADARLLRRSLGTSSFWAFFALLFPVLLLLPAKPGKSRPIACLLGGLLTVMTMNFWGCGGSGSLAYNVSVTASANGAAGGMATVSLTVSQ